MQKRDPLMSYREKRDFSVTPEPYGSIETYADTATSRGIFVIHRHKSSHLHYDLRLEFGGVLKCWAVPRGPSLDPRERRLAVPVEDHPLNYACFEGLIPEGEYGAGEMTVWDRGTYENVTRKKERPVPLNRAVEMGHLSIRLDGERVKGVFALTRCGSDKSGRWLLTKKKDSWSDSQTADPVTVVMADHQYPVIMGRTP